MVHPRLPLGVSCYFNVLVNSVLIKSNEWAGPKARDVRQPPGWEQQSQSSEHLPEHPTSLSEARGSAQFPRSPADDPFGEISWAINTGPRRVLKNHHSDKQTLQLCGLPNSTEGGAL